MYRLILSVFFFLFSIHVGVNAKNPSSGRLIKGGVRILSLQSLNDALQSEGLAKLNSGAFAFYIGQMIDREKFIFNGEIGYFLATGRENRNYSRFLGYGVSLDFGYKVWRNAGMCLYPYFNTSSYMQNLRTFHEPDVNSFSSAYAQPAVMRLFTNNGEWDAALGLSYRIKIAKAHFLTVNGGYHFRLWQGKWHYVNNKVDFPKVDGRGWEIGITWSRLRHKRTGKEE